MSFMKYAALKLDGAKTITVNKNKFIVLTNATFLCPCGTDCVLPWITVKRLKLEAAKRRATEGDLNMLHLLDKLIRTKNKLYETVLSMIPSSSSWNSSTISY